MDVLPRAMHFEAHYCDIKLVCIFDESPAVIAIPLLLFLCTQLLLLCPLDSV